MNSHINHAKVVDDHARPLGALPNVLLSLLMLILLLPDRDCVDMRSPSWVKMHVVATSSRESEIVVGGSSGPSRSIREL